MRGKPRRTTTERRRDNPATNTCVKSAMTYLHVLNCGLAAVRGPIEGLRNRTRGSYAGVVSTECYTDKKATFHVLCAST